MKKIYQLNKKYKTPVAIVLFSVGAVGLLMPIIPGLVLIGAAVFLLKDKPKEIVEEAKEVAEKTIEIVGDVGEEVEEKIKRFDIKRYVKKITKFVGNIWKKFKR